MQKLSNNVTFIHYDHNSNDNRILDELAHLTYDYWQEIEWPHRTKPINLVKLNLMTKFRVSQEVIHTVMLNDKNKAIGFMTCYFNTSGNNKFIADIRPYITPRNRRSYLLRVLLTEGLKSLPDYVTTVRFFYRIDNNQKYALEMQSFEKKLSLITPDLLIKHASTSRRSEADLTSIELQQISNLSQELVQKASENGYKIYFVDNLDFPNVPFTRKQYVKLLEELDNDMPREQGSQADSEISEEDFLNWFKFSKEEKLTEWLFIATDKNDEPIAMTETRIRGILPELAYVGDTGVKREHRGKRLGLTLKTLMLEKLLTDPISKGKVKTWITYNAFSNNYMISINDQLGYKQSSLEKSYEMPKEKLLAYLESVSS